MGHDSYVRAVAFSADGKRVLSGGTDATVRLWDAHTGKELRRFRKHAASVLAVSFTEDGRSTLSASNEAEVLLWELEKGRGDPTPSDPPAQAPVTQESPGKELRPVRALRVSGTVGALLLSPNGRWLNAFDTTAGKLLRWDTDGLKRAGELSLPAGTEVVTMTPNGKTLVALAPDWGGQGRGGRVQLIDARKWAFGDVLAVGPNLFDVAADDKGRIYLSGGRGDWSDVTVYDNGKLAGRWGGVWAKSFLRLSADQKRLYFSTQGVSPGSVEAFVIPGNPSEKPATYRSPARGERALGGEFLVTPDGRFVLSKTGVVLRSAAGPDADLRSETTLVPFLSAAVDADRRAAFLCTEDGTLRQYSYPEFKLQAKYKLPGVGYQAVCDGKSGLLYVAVFDPKALTARPRGRSAGAVCVFEVKGLLAKK
jgi:hypothetical protein